MRSYQSIIILKPDLDEPKVDSALEKITEFIKTSGGAILKVDKWGKKRLAYRVRKNRFGIYLNIYHTCENDKVSPLENEYKLFQSIIKYIVIRLDNRELERGLANDLEESSNADTPEKDRNDKKKSVSNEEEVGKEQ